MWLCTHWLASELPSRTTRMPRLRKDMHISCDFECVSSQEDRRDLSCSCLRLPFFPLFSLLSGAVCCASFDFVLLQGQKKRCRRRGSAAFSTLILFGPTVRQSRLGARSLPPQAASPEVRLASKLSKAPRPCVAFSMLRS